MCQETFQSQRKGIGATAPLDVGTPAVPYTVFLSLKYSFYPIDFGPQLRHIAIQNRRSLPLQLLVEKNPDIKENSQATNHETQT